MSLFGKKSKDDEIEELKKSLSKSESDFINLREAYVDLQKRHIESIDLLQEIEVLKDRVVNATAENVKKDEQIKSLTLTNETLVLRNKELVGEVECLTSDLVKKFFNDDALEFDYNSLLAEYGITEEDIKKILEDGNN